MRDLSVARSNRRSPLLKAPFDIRYMIYKQLLVIDSPIHVTYQRHYHDDRIKGFCLCVQCYPTNLQSNPIHILQTCRQIHMEAEPILYKLNTFHLRDVPSSLPTFLSSLGEVAYRSIRLMSLTISYGAPKDMDGWEFLAGCKNLQHLTIIGFDEMPKRLWNSSTFRGLRLKSVTFYPQPSYSFPPRESILPENFVQLTRLITGKAEDRTSTQAKKAQETQAEKEAIFGGWEKVRFDL